MKEIRKQIKERQFHKVYLLTGDEEYLLIQAKQQLRAALVMEGDNMNYRLYEENKFDLNEFRELASTFPFFSEKRLLVLDRTGILKSGKDEFVAILETIPDTTCVVICEPDVDKRSKVYKWIKKNGYIAEFMKKNQTEKVLMQWITAMLKRENKKMTLQDMQIFLQNVGDDMFQIKNEVDKLISYVGAREIIGREDIEAVTSEEIQNKIFELMDAIGQGEKKKALDYYDDLILLKEPPLRILYLISRQYRILLSISDMRKKGLPDAEIAQVAGVARFFLKRYDMQARRYSKKALLASLEACARTEQEIKTGLISDQLGVESIIVSLSQKA